MTGPSYPSNIYFEINIAAFLLIYTAGDTVSVHLPDRSPAAPLLRSVPCSEVETKRRSIWPAVTNEPAWQPLLCKFILQVFSTVFHLPRNIWNQTLELCFDSLQNLLQGIPNQLRELIWTLQLFLLKTACAPFKSTILKMGTNQYRILTSLQEIFLLVHY